MSKICLNSVRSSKFEIQFQKDFIVGDYVAVCSCCGMEENNKEFLKLHVVEQQQEMKFSFKSQKNFQMSC
jgi:hypothetical protein